jgi:2-oxoglutarate dehydrogenase E2 component (dihydrolipoamide succinyltransferase)
VVRKLAADHGVDLSGIVGTGVGGRIRREDVLAAATGGATAPAAVAAPAAPVNAATPVAPVAPALPAAPAVPPTLVAPAPAAAAPAAARTDSLIGTTQPAPRIRQAIARSMMHAVTTSAQTTTIIEVDATRVSALRDRVQATFRGREGIALTLVPFFVKAAIEAAKANPIVNASLSDDLTAITYHASVHLGLAVDTPRGQIAPVVHHADDLNVSALARRIADLADRTRRGALGPDELAGATLTVTDAGSPGALIDTPIVVPPQAATLALGAVAKRPVVVTDADGRDLIAVRSIATMALSYDQRFVDGSDAARYLATVKRRIEDGDFEADLGV